ncbi:hypothetical protein [Streptomyces sp. NPDC059862]
MIASRVRVEGWSASCPRAMAVVASTVVAGSAVLALAGTDRDADD